MAPKNEQILAEEFARTIRRDLSAAQIKKVNAINARDKDYCASHQFIDSNMNMAEAFKTVLARDPDVGGDTKASQRDIALWGRAWDIAIAASFFVPTTKKKVVA